MNIYLDEKWIDYCKKLPETGMGFQDVLICFRNGDVLKGVIYNCSIVNINKSGSNLYSTEDIIDIKIQENKA